jgi:hypothetical protein
MTVEEIKEKYRIDLEILVINPRLKDNKKWKDRVVILTLLSKIKELEAELAKIKSDPSVRAIIDWKEWIDKRPRSSFWKE